MKLDERVTVRMSKAELSWFQSYAQESDMALATTIRTALGYFMEAFNQERRAAHSQQK